MSIDTLFPIPVEMDPITYAVPAFVILILIELYLNWHRHLHLYETKDTFSSLALGIGSVILDIFVKSFFFIVFTWIHQYAIFPGIGWQWWAWLLIIFFDDFTFYWFHRTIHSVRLFWCAHSNHHSAKTINWAVALRQSWTELLIKNFFWMWLPLIGFSPLMVFMMMAINLIYQFWPHTEIIRRMPAWFEFIFNTPSHHRVHHASNIKYLDRNHAGILIIWDRMFGTFSQEDDREKLHYGITKNIDDILGNPLEITVHEYRDLCHDIKRAKSWKDRLRYIFYAPGWSHDGEDQRTEVLRKKADL